MPMQPRTWSINALSVELGIDRRTLSKRLAGLPPAETKRLKNRDEKRWHLADVLAHLQDPDASRVDAVEEALTEFRRIIGQNLYPSVITTRAFGAIIANGLQDELGLTPEQGKRAWELACVALSWGLAEALEDDEMEFRIPDCLTPKSIEEVASP